MTLDPALLLSPILTRVRTDISAAKTREGRVFRTNDAITPARLLKHLNGGPMRGVYPIRPGSCECRVAVLDLDSHKGETAWDDMTAAAVRVIAACAAQGLKATPWRSSGGKGIHLYFLWDEPQDAYSLRQALRVILAGTGFRDGTAGVARGEIEIFPKQDSVAEGGFGNQFFLPLAGKSVPLEPLLGLDPTDRDYAATLDWPVSDPVPVLERPAVALPPAPRELQSADLEKLRMMLTFIKPDAAGDYSYDLWINKVGLALHHETQGSDDGLDLWDEWSARGHSYPGHDVCKYKWSTFSGNTNRPTTVGTLKRLARDGGYVEDRTGDFEDLDALEGKPEKTGDDDEPDPVVFPHPADWCFIARKLLNQSLVGGDGVLTTRYVQNVWYRYNGQVYEEREPEAMRTMARRFLDTAYKRNPAKPMQPAMPYMPCDKAVQETLSALKTETYAEKCSAPAWLDGRPDAADYAVMTNGLLHLPTRTLHPHTPQLFSFNAMPFAWQPDAGAPAWLEFLDSLWGDDPESIDTLQDMFGYLVSGDTSQQKMFLIKGPPRSGKGTIARVLRELLGAHNTVSTSFAQLANDWGMEPLVGKLAAFLPEARNTGGRGHNNLQVAVERLLSISGEDEMSVPRKHIGNWNGYLKVRFVMLANAVPGLGDSTNAFASRFIVLETVKSFLGHEDDTLTARLLAELPGIFRWALDGRDRLKERRRFIQPQSGAKALDELADANNPVRAFVRDECEVGDHEIAKEELWHEYRLWCDKVGRVPGTYQTFCGTVIETFGPAGIVAVDKRMGKDKIKIFRGLRVKNCAFDDVA